MASAAPQVTRYRELETIRQYGLEKLAGAGDGPAVPDRHLEYYMRMAEGLESSGFGTGGGWWPKLDQDLDNIRAAIEWSVSSGKADSALRILGSSVNFWFARGHQITEWNEAVQNALSRPESQKRTPARARALKGLGFWYWADPAPRPHREASSMEAASAMIREEIVPLCGISAPGPQLRCARSQRHLRPGKAARIARDRPSPSLSL
jgi:hypothetical protein